MKNFEMIAKTLYGLEEVLATELKQLDATDIEPLNRAVKFTGNDALMYRCNLHLRSALRILKPIATFEAGDVQQLYEQIKRLRWGQYLTASQTFAIDATTSGQVFSHSKYVALKAKDAIVDQFREKLGTRPSVDTDNPDLRLNIHIFRKSCTISLDSTGTTLDRRGYRLLHNPAPVNEVLAAGILLMTGWRGETDLLDPMSGSGTFAIEAAMLAANIPPGHKRAFAFEKWRDFNSKLWKEIKTEGSEQIGNITGKIISADIDRRTLNVVRQNAETAGVQDMLRIKGGNFLAGSRQIEEGTIIINPPYDERMPQPEVMKFYTSIGDQLKKEYSGCQAWIISGNLQAIKYLGLKPARKITLFNGPLECRLHHYELYAGSRKG
mgnify:CR=1 FL=1